MTARLRNWLTWFGVALLWLLNRLPFRVRDSIAAYIARVFLFSQSRQLEVARTNLELVYPHWTSQSRERFLRLYFERYIQILVAMPDLWWSNDHSIESLVDINGIEHLHSVRQSNSPIIFLSVHSMALDFGVQALTRLLPLQGIYKPFSNPVIDKLFAKARMRFNGRPSSRGSGLRALMTSLKQGSHLLYICDEDFGPERSVFAPLFGQPKATLTALPRIARRTGAVVVPLVTNYDPGTGRYVLDILAPMTDYPDDDELQNALELNRIVETLIQVRPEQFLWKLKLFKSQPGTTQSRYRRRSE